jgi:tetratricopeptide (TPR) repeat protein
MLDVTLFGTEPGMHHLVNVALHCVNSVLLFVVLRRMTGALWRPFAVAALFALHPLHVESVAWISERKDVLSTLFGMLAMLAYSSYVARRGAWRYAMVALMLALGLMAKPMLVTLPFVLLLLDVWPLSRVKAGQGAKEVVRLVLEKVPLFALAAASSVLTFIAQRAGGAVERIEVLPLAERLANAATAYAAYLAKMLWPVNLSFFYPYPATVHPLTLAVSLVVLAALTAAAFMTLRRFPYAAVGWFWYLGTLVPVIGIVQVGAQSMADRYTYIPLVGIFMALAWGVHELAGNMRYTRQVRWAGLALVLLVLTGLTRVQAGYWKDSATLFSRALAVTRDNFVAHTNLAAALFEQGDNQAAMDHAGEALRIKPTYVPAMSNLGLGLMRQQRFAEAAGIFRQALAYDPGNVNARLNLGASLLSLGRVDEAAAQAREILQGHPGHAGASALMEKVKVRQFEMDERIRSMNNLIAIEPDNAVLRFRLAGLERARGNTDEAVAHYEKALELKPGFREAQHALALLYSEQGRDDEALAVLEEVLRSHPEDTNALYNTACIHARQGRTDQALQALRKAVAQGFTNRELLRTDPDLANLRGTPGYRELTTGR